MMIQASTIFISLGRHTHAHAHMPTSQTKLHISYFKGAGMLKSGFNDPIQGSCKG